MHLPLLTYCWFELGCRRHRDSGERRRRPLQTCMHPEASLVPSPLFPFFWGEKELWSVVECFAVSAGLMCHCVCKFLRRR